MGVFRVSIFTPRRIEILGIRPKPVRSASRSRHHHNHHHLHTDRHQKGSSEKDPERPRTADGNDPRQRPELEDECAGEEEMNSPIANADTSLRQQRAAKKVPAKGSNELSLQTKTNVKSREEEGTAESDVAIDRRPIARRDSINASVSFHHHHHHQKQTHQSSSANEGDDTCTSGGGEGDPCSPHRRANRARSGDNGRCCSCGNVVCGEPRTIDLDHPPADVEIVSKIVRETAGGPDRLYEVAFKISQVFRPATSSVRRRPLSSSSSSSLLGCSRTTSDGHNGDPRRFVTRGTGSAASASKAQASCHDTSFKEVIDVELALRRLLLETIPKVRCTWTRCSSILSSEECEGIGGEDGDNRHGGPPFGDDMDNDVSFVEVVFHAKRRTAMLMAQQAIEHLGIGRDYGHVSIIECDFFRPMLINRDECWVGVGNNGGEGNDNEGERHTESRQTALDHQEGSNRHEEVEKKKNPRAVKRRQLNSSEQRNTQSHGQGASRRRQGDQQGALLADTIKSDEHTAHRRFGDVIGNHLSAQKVNKSKGAYSCEKSLQLVAPPPSPQDPAESVETKAEVAAESLLPSSVGNPLSSPSPPFASRTLLRRTLSSHLSKLAGRSSISTSISSRSNSSSTTTTMGDGSVVVVAAAEKEKEVWQRRRRKREQKEQRLLRRRREKEENAKLYGLEEASMHVNTKGTLLFGPKRGGKKTEAAEKPPVATAVVLPHKRNGDGHELLGSQEKIANNVDSNNQSRSSSSKRQPPSLSFPTPPRLAVRSLTAVIEMGRSSPSSPSSVSEKAREEETEGEDETHQEDEDDDTEMGERSVVNDKNKNGTTNSLTPTTTATTSSSPLLHFSNREGITGAGGGVSSRNIGGGFGGGGGVGGGVGVSNLMSQLEDDEEGLDIAAQMRFDAVLANICANALVDFDFIAFLIISIVVGGLGLATNSPVSVLAAALLSPMMGPILATVMGTILVVQSRTPSPPSLRMAHIEGDDRTAEEDERNSCTTSYTGSISCSTCSQSTSSLRTRTRSPCVPEQTAQDRNPFVAGDREHATEAHRGARRKGRPIPDSASLYGNQSLRKKGVELLKLGFKVELLVLVTALTVGFIIGLAFWGSDKRYNWDENGTDQMKSRATPSILITGIFIAFCSGSGLVLSLLGSRGNSLAGVALNASLLPPVVNSGMYFALAIRTNVPSENVKRALFSLALTCINVAGIYVAALFMFFVKRFTPFAGVGWDFGGGPEGSGAVTTGKAIYRGGILGQRTAAVVREAKEREEAARTKARRRNT